MPKATACAGSCRHLRVSRASPTLHAYSTSTHIRASPTLHPSLSTTTTSLSRSRSLSCSLALSLSRSLTHKRTHTRTQRATIEVGGRAGGLGWSRAGGPGRLLPCCLLTSEHTQLACLSSLRTDLGSELPRLPASILCCLPSSSNMPPSCRHILLPSIYVCNKEACCRRLLRRVAGVYYCLHAS